MLFLSAVCKIEFFWRAIFILFTKYQDCSDYSNTLKSLSLSSSISMGFWNKHCNYCKQEAKRLGEQTLNSEKSSFVCKTNREIYREIQGNTLLWGTVFSSSIKRNKTILIMVLATLGQLSKPWAETMSRAVQWYLAHFHRIALHVWHILGRTAWKRKHRKTNLI